MLALSEKSRPVIEATLPVVGDNIGEIAERFYRHMYQIVYDNLMWAIGDVLGDPVTPAVADAWSERCAGRSPSCSRCALLNRRVSATDIQYEVFGPRSLAG